jgi:hypothetical protein
MYYFPFILHYNYKIIVGRKSIFFVTYNINFVAHLVVRDGHTVPSVLVT